MSGLKHDWNGAFRYLPVSKEDFTVRGEKCLTVGSYQELEKLDLLNKNSHQPLMIIQAGHGDKGGGVDCNAGYEDPEVVLGVLEKMAASRQVLWTGISCYSGDLLKKKLMRDTSRDPNDPTVSRLCMVTASLFGRVAYGDGGLSYHLGSLAKDAPVTNPEQLYQNMDRGLISSGDWDQLGVTQYFLEDSFDNSIKVVESFSRLRVTCRTPGRRIAASNLCLGASDQYRELISAVRKTNSWIDGNEYRQMLSDAERWIEEFLQRGEDFQFQMERGAPVTPAFLKCLVGVIAELKKAQRPEGWPPEWIEGKIKFVIQEEPFCQDYTYKDVEGVLQAIPLFRRIPAARKSVKNLVEEMPHLRATRREISPRAGCKDIRQNIGAILGESLFIEDTFTDKQTYGPYEIEARYEYDDGLEPTILPSSLLHRLARAQIRQKARKRSSYPHDVSRRKACQDFKL